MFACFAINMRACFLCTHIWHISWYRYEPNRRTNGWAARVYRKIEWFVRSKIVHFGLSFVHICGKWTHTHTHMSMYCASKENPFTLYLYSQREKEKTHMKSAQVVCVRSCSIQILCWRFCLSKCCAREYMCWCARAYKCMRYNSHWCDAITKASKEPHHPFKV